MAIPSKWLVEKPETPGMLRLFRNTVIPYINQQYMEKIGSPLYGFNNLSPLPHKYYGMVDGCITIVDTIDSKINKWNPVKVYTLEEFMLNSPEYINFWVTIVRLLDLDVDKIDFEFTDLYN